MHLLGLQEKFSFIFNRGFSFMIGWHSIKHGHSTNKRKAYKDKLSSLGSWPSTSCTCGGGSGDSEAGLTTLSSDHPIVQKMAWHQERCTRSCWLSCLRQA